jgi:predicted RNA-binding protein YlqC (UPF0109 family)
VSAVRDVIETVAKALADTPLDVGKLIGRQGRTIQAMRTLATLAGERLGKRVTLEVRDVSGS